MRKLFLLLLAGSVALAQQQNAYLYSTNPQNYHKAMEIKRRFEKTILMLDKVKIALFPKYESLRAIETVPIHPAFSTTILFEGGWKIIDVESTLKPRQFKYFENTLIIQPQYGQLETSVDVFLQNDKGEKMAVKLILYPADTVSGKVFYPYLVFVDRKILSPQEVWEYYYHLTGKIPNRYTEIFIDGITYFIKPVEKFGNFNYKGKAYLIGVNYQKPLY